jgi:hypothetical protein
VTAAGGPTQEQWDDARFGGTGQYGTPPPPVRSLQERQDERRARVIAALAGKSFEWLVRPENYVPRHSYISQYAELADRFLQAVDTGALRLADIAPPEVDDSPITIQV